MPRLTGVLGAIGTIILAIVLLVAMVWGLGQPGIVSWWRGEYLMAGFATLLTGAVVMAFRAKKTSATKSQQVVGVVAPLVKGLGIATGALLLMALVYMMVMH